MYQEGTDHLIWSNYDLDLEDWRESLEELYPHYSEDELYEKMYDSNAANLDDERCNLNIQLSSPILVIGDLGLWYGRPSIEPLACEDIESAIRKCANNMDYVIVKQVNGHIEVTGIHHDGSNNFEIYILNDKGIRANELIKEGKGNADLSRRCYHKSLNGYLF